MSGAPDAAAHVPPGGSDAADETTGSAGVLGAARHGARWWVAASVAVAFGLFYAYDLFEAISNLLGVAQLNGLAAEAGVAPVVPWALPIFGVASPPAAYVAALLLGRRQNVGVRALLLLAGLAVVAAVTLSITVLA